MNKLKNLTFWEKYRPTLINKGKGIPIILLPRIRKIIDGFKNDDGEVEIKFNILLFGTGGTGKTSLINILTETTDFRMIKATERGVDTIEIIEDHCKNFTLPLKKKGQKGDPNGQKIIWLEEFDQTTIQFRNALRSFMEEYPNVRFVATANNISKLQRTEEEKALIGRFNLINFEPETVDEKDYLKEQQIKYLKAVGKNVKLEMGDDIYEKIVVKSFPNLRIGIQTLQEIYISGSWEQYEHTKANLNQDVFEFIMNGKNDLRENFFYVQENFPRDKTEDLLNLLGRPFFKYLLENDSEMIKKAGFKIANLSKNYNYQYTLTIDPEMHLFNYVSQLKELING